VVVFAGGNAAKQACCVWGQVFDRILPSAYSRTCDLASAPFFADVSELVKAIFHRLRTAGWEQSNWLDMDARRIPEMRIGRVSVALITRDLRWQAASRNADL
jgi:hypothetical protein